MITTGKPTRIKTWRLHRTNVEQADFIFLNSLGVKIRAERAVERLSNQGYNFDVAGSLKIDIETYNDKQEVGIKLKYGTDLVLMLDELVLGDWQMCKLGESF